MPAIEPVHDARAQLAADAAEIIDMVQQRVHQRAAVVSSGRMDHHSRWLVEDYDVGIFVEDGEGQILGDRNAGDRRWQRNREPLPGPHVRARSQSADRCGDVAVLDQALDVRSGSIRQECGEKRVEPLAVVILADGHLDARCRPSVRPRPGRAGARGHSGVDAHVSTLTAAYAARMLRAASSGADPDAG